MRPAAVKAATEKMKARETEDKSETTKAFTSSKETAGLDAAKESDKKSCRVGDCSAAAQTLEFMFLAMLSLLAARPTVGICYL